MSTTTPVTPERGPPFVQVESLLHAAALPWADLTPAHMTDFFSVGPADAPQGVVGVELHGDVALLRSLAVVAPSRGKGLGHALVAAAEAHARAGGASALYLLTTTAEPFFEALGYHRIERDAAPEPIRRTREFAALCPATAVLMVKRLPAPASPG